MVEKTEKILRNSLSDMNLWFMKIQNIHTVTTPADFIIIGEYRYLIEVKEVSCFKGYNIFPFSRLTQYEDLENFHFKHHNNHSFILLNFRERTLKKSDVYMIPFEAYRFVKNTIGKKSFNREDAIEHFTQFQLNILPGSKLNLNPYII